MNWNWPVQMKESQLLDEPTAGPVAAAAAAAALLLDNCNPYGRQGKKKRGTPLFCDWWPRSLTPSTGRYYCEVNSCRTPKLRSRTRPAAASFVAHNSEGWVLKDGNTSKYIHSAAVTLLVDWPKENKKGKLMIWFSASFPRFQANYVNGSWVAFHVGDSAQKKNGRNFVGFFLPIQIDCGRSTGFAS